MYGEVQHDMNCIDWRQILNIHTSKYIALDGCNLWPPKKTTKGNSEGQDMMTVYKNHIKALQKKNSELQKGNNANNNNPQRNNRRQVKCWDCDQVGHVRGDPSCPKKTQVISPTNNVNTTRNNNNQRTTHPNIVKIPPKDGEPHHKMINGVFNKWCNTCQRWTSGKFLHNTQEHVVGKHRNNPNQNRNQATNTQSNQQQRQQTVPNNQSNLAYSQPEEPTGTLSLMQHGFFGMHRGTSGNTYGNQVDTVPYLDDNDDIDVDIEWKWHKVQVDELKPPVMEMTPPEEVSVEQPTELPSQRHVHWPEGDDVTGIYEYEKAVYPPDELSNIAPEYHQYFNQYYDQLKD